MEDFTGPTWLTCLSEVIDQYRDDVDEMEDDMLMSESYRVEVLCPPEVSNDRDWRTYRRFVRQEMHHRGLTTPTADTL